MKYFVHCYKEVRVKVAVEAESQQDAIRKAEETDFDLLLTRVGPFPGFPAVEHIEFADETHGYLVDEADDLEYQQSRAYDAERQPQ